ncbi:MAG: hypothetical protein ACI9J3_000416 [Parvicellaceae bacterium]
MGINAGVVIGIIVLAYFLWKYFKAKDVIGKKLLIKPIKKNSNLSYFMQVDLIVDAVKREGREEVWLRVKLPQEVVIGKYKFDFVLVKPRKEDDNVNRKNAVVCYFKAGYSHDPEKLTFIDWASVKVG